ncbi:MAG TPA: EVE domain-containing protein [Alphaproteobacteria bacterium]|nr:EVE domain-containing protein [Alphaproteobacteria bacterium]
MPRYWILCMSEDNYLIAKKQGLIGMSEQAKSAIHKITTGDIITFYISKKKVDAPPNDLTQRVREFRGIARVSGEVFESNDLIWNVRDKEIFPYRRKVDFLSDARAAVRPLIEKPSFVTNTIYWALPLRKGYVEISPKDFDMIQEAMKVGRGNQTGAV